MKTSLILASILLLSSCKSTDPRVLAALNTGISLAESRGKITSTDAADARKLLEALTPADAPAQTVETPTK